MYTPSYWERESVFAGIDVCIIGSGIVGLSAAIHLKQLTPTLRVMVVDRGFLPYGASTRNAGFACYGSMTELLDDVSKESENTVIERVQMRWNGLQKLRSMLGDEAIGYEPLGGYEIFTDNDKESFDLCVSNLQRFNSYLKEVTGLTQTYSLADEHILRFGFNGVSHMILNAGEGQIDTGKMMNALEEKARMSGVRIINGLTIEAVEDIGSQVIFSCAGGFEFTSNKCIVANNGFAASLLPDIDVKPARAQVLITKPIPDLKVKGSFHYDAGYYYFRNVGDRILFGGGRNLDFKGETTVEFGQTPLIQNRLEDLLKTVIIPETEFEVDMRWSGIMGLGNSKSTIVKTISPNLTCAVRMGGMGVAIGSLIGEQAAEMLTGG